MPKPNLKVVHGKAGSAAKFKKRQAAQTKTRQAADKRNPIPQTTPIAVLLLISLHLFLALGAVGGGAALIADPSGESMGMPVSLLERSFFPNFFIPGILLLLLFGAGPLVVAYGLWRLPRWPAAEAVNPYRRELHPVYALSLYVGFGQIVWIAVQTYMMNSVSPVQLLYTSMGLLIAIATLLPSVRIYCLKKA
ncbi:hypothetical protein QWJ34_02145 [Saccharibacillus sp. CPCC 101409]|uniref:hypothetical protein n=1 Tax=Saccharibacillus sp. CPCC 101409 TaxID=3058041 RepID=UPI002672F50E|nr:hypothetical protein [Saccharibacillus sp. CPCC 101409]MDO3408563.1 hypothetical protein [Saccharibacillus sp. CPCC 101409]